MSEASSGGVRSRAMPHRFDDLVDRLEQRVANLLVGRSSTVLGTPATRSRPLISIVWTSSPGYAEPMVILISSAVRSPTSRLYLRLMYWTIASSILSPPTRTELEKTMPAERDHRDLGGAAADIDDHVAGRLGDRQPGADRRRHRLLDQVDFARAADSADSRTARFSTSVMPNGTQMMMRGRTSVRAVVHLLDEVAQHRLGDFKISDNAVL